MNLISVTKDICNSVMLLKKKLSDGTSAFELVSKVVDNLVVKAFLPTEIINLDTSVV